MPQSGLRARTPAAPRRSRIWVVPAAIVAVAMVVMAAVLLRQDVAVTPAVQAPDVVFANGADYTAINAAGFATLALGSNATSATLTVNGIPGAASLQLGDLLKLVNQDATQGYTVTLIRSAAPASAISAFTITVQNAADTEIVQWNAKTTAQSSSFSLAASTTYDITLDYVIADGTAVGALTGFTIQVQLVPL